MTPSTVIAMLAMLLGLQCVTTDVYLPGLPQITQQLSSTPASTQLTLSALLLSFGISQLFWGPLSDRFGRRPILLAGLSLYVLAALGCALAGSMPVLVAWRIVQGIAMGAGVMAARAIVRDLFTPAAGMQAMSKALTGLGVLACSSPLVGSVLVNHLGWRATMVAVALFGAACLWLVATRYQESLPENRRNPVRLGHLGKTWHAIVRNRTFLAYSATTSCSYAVLFTFLAASSFTFTGVLGWSTSEVGILLGVNGAFYIAGTLLCRRMLRRMGVQHAVAIAGGMAVVAASAMVIMASFQVRNGLAYALPFLLYMVSHGIQQPCGQSGAVSAFPHAAGTAAALNGFLMMLVAYTMGSWLGAHLDDTVWPLVLGVAFWAFGAALASWTLVARWGQPSRD